MFLADRAVTGPPAHATGPKVLSVPRRDAVHAAGLVHCLDDLRDGWRHLALLCGPEFGLAGSGLRIALDVPGKPDGGLARPYSLRRRLPGPRADSWQRPCYRPGHHRPAFQ